jgi:beta-glucanase (GH16 family)
MDVVENLGSEPTMAHATIHAGVSTGTGEWLSGLATTVATPLSAGYHDYGLIWGPNALAMTVDGRTYMTVSASDPLPTNYWNFNHPFYLLLNLAVGGNWPGSPDTTTTFPATLSVDSVRVTG